MLPFSRPSCYFKTRPPSCALGTSFYTVSEGRDLMTYVSDNYTSYSAPSEGRDLMTYVSDNYTSYSAPSPLSIALLGSVPTTFLHDRDVCES